jgi:hypothetical protein
MHTVVEGGAIYLNLHRLKPAFSPRFSLRQSTVAGHAGSELCVPGSPAPGGPEPRPSPPSSAAGAQGRSRILDRQLG